MQFRSYSKKFYFPLVFLDIYLEQMKIHQLPGNMTERLNMPVACMVIVNEVHPYQNQSFQENHEIQIRFCHLIETVWVACHHFLYPGAVTVFQAKICPISECSEILLKNNWIQSLMGSKMGQDPSLTKLSCKSTHQNLPKVANKHIYKQTLKR